jgi:hypothetical protein
LAARRRAAVYLGRASSFSGARVLLVEHHDPCIRLKQVSQGHLVPLHCRNRCVGIALWVDQLPVELVTGVGSQLSEESALGASVAVAKRVQRVDVAEIVGEPIDEGFAIEIAEPVLLTPADARGRIRHRSVPRRDADCVER